MLLLSSESNEELKRSATKASIVHSKIKEDDLEDIRLSYYILDSVTLWALGLEERADDSLEGFIAIYEPTMQQGLCLPVHHFFHEVLRNWNLAQCPITLNG
ncbi:hypothetical protein Adt_41354 [Abeliophyllum distichum]|uniref:Uncharacterized protein n=1 Tax=Abeliophyllum distichum TaxID=126358 RepID=A0ABD1PQ39_9LAMI